MAYSPLQQVRYGYQPKLPGVLREDIRKMTPMKGAATESASDHSEIRERFPHTYGMPMVRFEQGENPDVPEKRNIGVVLSGGQAPGGHNVIAGLYDALASANPESKLYGFIGGPSGILKDDCRELTGAVIDEYRNTGGFDIIGSGRTKLESESDFAQCAKVCNARSICALVIIGGDDSNTNAAMLAEYFVRNKSGIQVIGVPKTIDGDLKNEHIEASFGFDTATKTYAELIGNIQRDANSSRKYWHFIKLMGRSASHICLECALLTRPTMALISEEVEAKKQTLGDIVSQITDCVVSRGRQGMHFGIVLVPEGLIEFIPEMKTLISRLNDLLAQDGGEISGIEDPLQRCTKVATLLPKASGSLFSTLPQEIQMQLLLDRDPHGNVQVSRIETEKLLIQMVADRLRHLRQEGIYTGPFSSQHHFFGYEGRCAFPSNFDADYCYSLGYTAFLLIASGLTGYISSVTGLSKPADKWNAGGVPITMMMNMEKRHGSQKSVIRKALVELDGKPFGVFAASRDAWASGNEFLYPGAIQYFGPPEVCDRPSVTLTLEQES